MNPVLLYFASGDSLYCGAVLLLLMVAISPYLTHRWLLRFRNLVTWLALTMIVLACPPFSWFVDATFLAAFLLWFIASNRLAPPANIATHCVSNTRDSAAGTPGHGVLTPRDTGDCGHAERSSRRHR